MTNGYGAMPDYSAQIAPEDRWAIAAYIRALQYSQSASVAAVPSGAKIDSLADIAVSEGYDASFAGPWVLPQRPTCRRFNPDKLQRRDRRRSLRPKTQIIRQRSRRAGATKTPRRERKLKQGTYRTRDSGMDTQE